jgi:dimethylsulfone monooxygenase
MSTNPLLNSNRLKLGVFGFNGQAPSNTLVDELYAPTWPRILDIAAKAEVSRFEALVPFARWKRGRVRDSSNLAALDVYDPYIWAAGLAQATRYPAVLATSHMSLMHPVIAAKQAATIDQMSGGRFALNVVAGWNQPEFEMFGGSMPSQEDRFEQAAEWLEVVTRLWRETEDFDFEGRFYCIKKGESFPKPIQVPFPPVMSAGGSDKGRRFAAKYADLCFTIVRGDDIDLARADVTSFRDLARREYGRPIQMWTVAYVIQRESLAAAHEYEQHVLDHADHRANEAMMAMIGAQSKMMPVAALEAIKRRYILGAGGFPLVGTAESIVDQCRALSRAGIDGILLCWIDFMDGLDRWIGDVMPMLIQAGLRDSISA